MYVNFQLVHFSTGFLLLCPVSHGHLPEAAKWDTVYRCCKWPGAGTGRFVTGTCWNQPTVSFYLCKWVTCTGSLSYSFIKLLYNLVTAYRSHIYRMQRTNGLMPNADVNVSWSSYFKRKLVHTNNTKWFNLFVLRVADTYRGVDLPMQGNFQTILRLDIQLVHCYWKSLFSLSLSNFSLDRNWASVWIQPLEKICFCIPVTNNNLVFPVHWFLLSYEWAQHSQNYS